MILAKQLTLAFFILAILSLSACNAKSNIEPQTQEIKQPSVLRGISHEGDAKSPEVETAEVTAIEAPTTAAQAPKSGFLANLFSFLDKKPSKHTVEMHNEKTGENVTAEFSTNGAEKSVSIGGTQMGFGDWPTNWPTTVVKYQNATVKSFQKTGGIPDLGQNPALNRYMVDFSTTDHPDAIANFYRGIIPNYNIPLSFENKMNGRNEMTFKNQNTKDIFLVTIQPLNGGGADVSLTFFDEP